MSTIETARVLIMQQLTSMSRCDFAIRDREGSVVGAVVTGGGAFARFASGPRQLTVLDSDGNAYVHLDDIPNLGPDRFEMYAADGRCIGSVTKEVTFLRRRITVDIAGHAYELAERDFAERTFDLLGPHGRVAVVRRAWPDMLHGLLDRNTYVVGFETNQNPTVRRAALGAVLALELVRLKDRRQRGV